MTKTILVTGDPICDHNYYKGTRRTADSEMQRGFRHSQAGGGALLLKKLIATVMEGAGDWTTHWDLDEDYHTLPLAYHSFCLWEPQVGNPDATQKNQVEFWRAVEPPLGYGHTMTPEQEGQKHKLRADAYTPSATPCLVPPDIVVIDDAGLGFRQRKELWSGIKADGSKPCPRWVVLKLTGAIGKSPLWDDIAAQCHDNLVVIVPAEELRRRDVRLSRGLSWEATAMDLMAELRGNPRVTPLRAARHLIVTFQSDAAFWFNNDPKTPSALLVFDASRAEGEWSASQGKGGAFGYLSCFTAAIVRELSRTPAGVDPDLEAALGAGLGASRELRHLGHGQVAVKTTEPEPGFPFAEIGSKIRQYDDPLGADKFVSAVIPQGARDRQNWMMLDEWQVQARNTARPLPYYEAARAVAVLGPEALERFPVAEFGNYQTVDRKEIESLRTIRQLINNYMALERPKTPLNLGVFGPPGSGKSYIVIEIAKAALNLQEEDILLFNLSQFSEPSDLFDAFHQVRDKVLRGETTVAFWDEFDAQKYKWLQYLLAPMEDGFFQEGQIKHPIGKCIFFFAGATSATYEKFGPTPVSKEQVELIKDTDQLRSMEAASREFVLAKGPDFKSRLVGYLNMLGMNPRQHCEELDGRRYWENDESDLCYPIRRALFIRSVFKVKKGQQLAIDRGVLCALLEIPKYKSGGRSPQFLCKHLQQNSSGTPRRSSLPGRELLDMHVDEAAFWKICERDLEFLAQATVLAQEFHEDWCKNAASKDNESNKPWAELDEPTRASNVEQALRISTNLSVVDLRIEQGPPLPPEQEQHIRNLIEQQIETLAEAEHNGWMIERMIAGWRYAKLPKKDPVKKLHPLLFPYAQLPEAQKEKDRRPIRGFSPNAQQKQAGEEPVEGYIERLKRVGFRVSFSDTSTPSRPTK